MLQSCSIKTRINQALFTTQHEDTIFKLQQNMQNFIKN